MSININLWAVVASALAAFLLGGLWYSPVLFLNTWLREAGVQKKDQHSMSTYIISILLMLVAAFIFALFLGPKPSLVASLAIGLITGIGWGATSFGINYAYAGKSFKLFLIDGGYHTLQFVLYGLILGLLH
jgi:hypothetical protein